MNDLKRNGSGYVDPTAYEAIKEVSKEQRRMSQTIDAIYAVARLGGFDIVERIVLKDKKSGHIWR